MVDPKPGWESGELKPEGQGGSSHGDTRVTGNLDAA